MSAPDRRHAFRDPFRRVSEHVVALLELTKAACLETSQLSSSERQHAMKMARGTAAALAQLQEACEKIHSAVEAASDDVSAISKATEGLGSAVRLVDQSLAADTKGRQAREECVRRSLEQVDVMAKTAGGFRASSGATDETVEDLSDAFDKLISTTKKSSSRSLLVADETPPASEPTTPVRDSKPKRMVPRSLKSRSSHFGTLKRDPALARFTSKCLADGCRCTNFGSNMWQQNRCVNCMHLLDKHTVSKQRQSDVDKHNTLRKAASQVETLSSPAAEGVTTPSQMRKKTVVSSPEPQAAESPESKAFEPVPLKLDDEDESNGSKGSKKSASTSSLEKAERPDSSKADEDKAAEPEPRKRKQQRRKIVSGANLPRPQLRVGATMFLSKLDRELLKSSSAHYFAKTGDLVQLREFAKEVSKSPEELWRNGNANLQTPLHVALEAGQSECALFLVEKYSEHTVGGSAPLQILDKVGRSHLAYAARFGEESVVRDLVSRDGVDIFSKDMFGDTPLHIAAANRHISCMQVLLRAGDEDDSNSECYEIRNNFQETPLHKAARSGDAATVEVLLSHGASVEAVAAHGLPFDVIPEGLPPTAERHLRALLRTSDSSPNIDSRLLDEGTKIEESLAALSGDSSSKTIDDALEVAYGSTQEVDVAEGDLSSSSAVIARPKVADLCVFRCSQVESDPKAIDEALEDRASSAISIGAIDDLSNFVEGVFEPFRNNYFNKRIMVFCSPDLNVAGEDDQPAEPALFVTKRTPNAGVFEGLFINKWGFNPFLLPETAVSKALLKIRGDKTARASAAKLSETMSSATPAEIEQAITLHLDGLSRDGSALDFSPDFDKSTRETAQTFMEAMSPVGEMSARRKKRQTFGLLTRTPFSKQTKKRTKRDGRATQQDGWYVIADSAISGGILGLEAKLGRGTVNSFGLVLCKPGQTKEEEYFANESSRNFERFCAILGDSVELCGWSGFAGGFETMNTDQRSTYTSWRGFEVCFKIWGEINFERRH
jgi:ankyrin repeat protein